MNDESLESIEAKSNLSELGNTTDGINHLSLVDKESIRAWHEKLNAAPKCPVVIREKLAKDGIKTSFESLDSKATLGNEWGEILKATFGIATGSTNIAFSAFLFNSCVSACSSTVNESKCKSEIKTGILSALYSLQPRDEIEGMLITRLISIHTQSMEYLSRASNEGQTTQGIDININCSTKLMRLYNETLEALMRYRRKGEQKVIVQHVNVNDGGKAIVGSTLAVNGTGGKS